MKPTATLSLLASAIAITSCSDSAIEVRSIKQNLAEGRQPANSRVAEGNGQLALGNVGLAIEAYRKALREQPDNVEAMIGLATCYDRMGRSDLSRRHYEMALAVEPANTDVYSHFAQSLDDQGQRDEAARVKAELAARVVAPEAAREVPGSVPVLPPPPAQSVTVALAPPRSLPVAVERPAGNGVRLERISLREVALVTRTERPQWDARTVARTATSTTIRFERKPQAAVTLLNAARIQGLAARTRAYLTGRGFGGVLIGDAPAVRRQSAILYSQADTPRAKRLAAQFGFALEKREGAKAGVTILLGRDAARDVALRPTA
jgi:tetratricopeptide (TPR) repeat protein